MATTKFPLSLTVQYADKQSSSELTRPLIRRWVRAALLAPAELNIRFVDEAEGRELNRGYRNKNYATNVLTFAYNEQAGDAMPDSGTEQALTQADIILCGDVLKREADEQRISLVAHAAHLVVHGILHAQGYDHESDEEAAEMEQLETEILAGLGIADPYHPR